LERCDDASATRDNAAVLVSLAEGGDEVETGEDVENDEDCGDHDVDESGGVLSVLEDGNGETAARKSVSKRKREEKAGKKTHRFNNNSLAFSTAAWFSAPVYASACSTRKSCASPHRLAKVFHSEPVQMPVPMTIPNRTGTRVTKIAALAMGPRR
jgi:hypothetical protein